MVLVDSVAYSKQILYERASHLYSNEQVVSPLVYHGILNEIEKIDPIWRGVNQHWVFFATTNSSDT